MRLYINDNEIEWLKRGLKIAMEQITHPKPHFILNDILVRVEICEEMQGKKKNKREL